MAENTQIQATPEVAEQNAPTEQKEATLLAKITNYEDIIQKNSEKITQLENELKQKELDLSSLKTRNAQLEEQASEAQKFKAQHLKEAEEIEALKERSEDTLTRAKGIIFDKTKVIKNQELQIDALNQQITSLKDVVSITKDLLEIRNLEVKQLESKIQCMEDRVGAERERHDLMHKKLESMIRYNGDLKREYETQLCLFSALRERYSERELARGVLDDATAGVNVATAAVQTAAAADAASTSQVNGDATDTTEPKSDDAK